MAVTQYADAFTGAASTTFNITLNSTAIADANTQADVTNGRLYIALLHENDFEFNESFFESPETTGSLISNIDGGRFYTSEQSGTSKDPALTIGHTDGSSTTVYAEGSGGDDDCYIISSGEGDDSGGAARNATTGSGSNDTLTYALLGHAKIFFPGFLNARPIYRVFLAFDVTGSSAKTINSLSLRLETFADLTGFTASGWHSRKVYVCKTSLSAGTDLNSNANWNALDGWASSGTYEATETAATYDSLFFGTNF
tara:strand:+ start:180 stop:944 length:765 start_codon:yes stop_codon:yes gene_type:complete